MAMTLGAHDLTYSPRQHGSGMSALQALGVVSKQELLLVFKHQQQGFGLHGVKSLPDNTDNH